MCGWWGVYRTFGVTILRVFCAQSHVVQRCCHHDCHQSIPPCPSTIILLHCHRRHLHRHHLQPSPLALHLRHRNLHQQGSSIGRLRKRHCRLCSLLHHHCLLPSALGDHHGCFFPLCPPPSPLLSPPPHHCHHDHGHRHCRHLLLLAHHLPDSTLSPPPTHRCRRPQSPHLPSLDAPLAATISAANTANTSSACTHPPDTQGSICWYLRSGGCGDVGCWVVLSVSSVGGARLHRNLFHSQPSFPRLPRQALVLRPGLLSSRHARRTHGDVV